MSTTRPHPRFTIGQIMGLIAALAFAWAILASPGAARFVVTTLLPITLILVGPLILAHHLIDNSIGLACPHCQRAALERRALASFGPRFYRCAGCGIRLKRVFFGTWEDASDAIYDPKFLRKPDEDPWTAPPGLEDEDLIYSKTHVNLIHNKRRRQPENPNGPGLE